MRWKVHRESLVKDPSVLRLYTFEENSGDTVRNMVGHDGWGDLAIAANPHYSENWPLWIPKDYPSWTSGRWPGKGALSFGMASKSAYRSHFYASKDNHFTVETWVRVYRKPGDKTSMELCYVEDTQSSGWKIVTGPSYTAFQLGRPPGSGPGKGGVAVYAGRLSEDVWHQVVAELDGTDIELFIDGKLAGKKNFDGIYTQPKMSERIAKTPELDSGGLVLGNRTASSNAVIPSPRFDMDEFVLFDRVLSPDEVAGEYAAGVPDQTPEEQIDAHRRYLARQAALDSIVITIPTTSFGYFPVQQPVSASIVVPAATGLGPLCVVSTLTDVSGTIVSSRQTMVVGTGTVSIVPPKCALYWWKIALMDGGGTAIRQRTYPIASVLALQSASGISPNSPLAGHDIVQNHPADMVLGARADRMIAPFLRILPDGSYDWKIPDACVEAATKNGLDVLYTIYPPFNMPHDSPHELAQDPDRWSAWVHELVTHFKGKVHLWEIWNEPNAVPGFSATDYVILLKAAYKTIHEVDPGATVVGGCGVYTISQWTDAVLAAGGGPYMDVLSVHNYIGNSPVSYRNQFQKVRGVQGLVRKYLGHPLPVWNSEGGIHQPARIDGKIVTDEQLLKLYGSRANSHNGWATAGVDAIMMTTEHRSACWNVESILMDLADGDAKYFTLMGAGTFYPFKSSSQGLPTEKGISYAAMAGVLSTSKSIGWIPLASSKAAGILVTDAGGHRTAVLFSDVPLDFTFNAKAGQNFEGMDFLGNRLNWSAGNNGLTLHITEDPTYIFNVPADFAERHLLSIRAFPKEVLPHQTIAGELIIAAWNPESMKGIRATSDSKTSLLNISATSSAGTITMGAILGYQDRTLHAGFQFEADGKSHGRQSLQFTLSAGGKTISQLEVPFYAEGAATEIPRIDAPMALDGKTDAWAALKPEVVNQSGNVVIGKPDVGFENKNTWQGPADCSFTVKTAYRPGDGIYVLIDVTDDAFHPTPAGNRQPWLWDGLELFVDTRTGENRTAAISPGAQQIMVVPAGSAVMAPCTVINLAGSKATVDATFTGHATDHGYLLEGKIAPKNGAGWELKPGTRLGLDFAIDDNDDGVKRKAQLVLHGTASDSVDTSGWGEYQLAASAN